MVFPSVKRETSGLAGGDPGGSAGANRARLQKEGPIRPRMGRGGGGRRDFGLKSNRSGGEAVSRRSVKWRSVKRFP